MKLTYKNYIRLIRQLEIMCEEEIFQDVLKINKKENVKWISGQNL